MGGSSPLARGTLRNAFSKSFSGRLIPARAGNTEAASIPWAGNTAHPRSRGEHEEYDGYRIVRVGSSPLARGTLMTVFDGLKAIRLIPARAGNTGQHHQ